MSLFGQSRRNFEPYSGAQALDFPALSGYERNMKTRFPVPVRWTRVKTFRSHDELRVALKGARVVLDGGVPGYSAGSAVFRLAGGEGCKRWRELERLLTWLADSRAERSQPLVVIGGGAVLDLGALASSLYRRGTPLILIPTTLLGMVDATLGGKTAVDLELGGRLLKNFAGTFHPAAEIWLCTEFLRTLSPRERVSGAGEVFKTMWIRGRAWNQKALAEFVRTGEATAALGRVVQDCLAVKAKLVEKDPLDDRRVRELLNFGHTVGHALESAARGRLSHGECVLWGMAVETSLLGAAGKRMLGGCQKALSSLGLERPPELSGVSEAEWVKLLGADKKAKGGLIEMSLLAAPRRVVKKRVSPADLACAIRSY